jgi:hypothetical protein
MSQITVCNTKGSTRLPRLPLLPIRVIVIHAQSFMKRSVGCCRP